MNMDEEIKVGDQVAVGKLEDAKQDFLYRGYLGEVTKVRDDYAFVETDKLNLFQSVSFKAWLPMSKLTRVG